MTRESFQVRFQDLYELRRLASVSKYHLGGNISASCDADSDLLCHARNTATSLFEKVRALELEAARQQSELESARREVDLLRRRIVEAEAALEELDYFRKDKP